MTGADPALRPAGPDAAGRTSRTPGTASTEAATAADVQSLLAAGNAEAAREAFEGIVCRQQARATAIAYHYLRDGAEADEAVQDAFVKAYTRIDSYNRDLSFEAWFTRILINGCLDRQKIRTRRERWLIPVGRWLGTEPEPVGDTAQSPEALLLRSEQRRRIAQAVRRLPGRQRTVFILCHYGDLTVKDVAASTGLSEATVRVHLFRAIRKLRPVLQEMV